MQYSEHHCHTIYSAMDGVSTADEYFSRAKEIGVDHITITDHKTLAGHYDAQEAAQKHGLSLGLGLEGYFSETDRFDKRSRKERDDGTRVYHHLGIIAKNENGLKNLYALNERAWIEGFYNAPRVDLDLLEEYHEDLIVLSGCLGGVLSNALKDNDYAKAVKYADRFKSIFQDDYYIEVMSHNPQEINDGLFKIADEMDLKTIITSDCHHARAEDVIKQEAMLILSTQKKNGISSPDFSKANKMDWLERFNYLYPDRKLSFQDLDLHLHNATEHLDLMKKAGYDRTDFIENTLEIADKIGDYPVYKDLDVLPRPKGVDVDQVLREKVWEGMERLGISDKPEYVERAQYELEVIINKNFSSYFLIVEDIVRFARAQNILMSPARGSAAGSLVCWALDITHGIDPIKHNLLFERFMDPDRLDWPDVDLDFMDNRRDEVKAYAERKFKHTANLMTFTFLDGKNIAKDAANILKVPYDEINKATKSVINYDDFCTSKSTQEFRRKYPEVKKLGDIIKGQLRSVGMHAAGIIVADQPLTEYAPTESAEHPTSKVAGRVPVLAIDKKRAEKIGLVKMDFLGLKTLTVIQETLDLIKERHDKEIDLYSIDFEDQEVYRSIDKRSTLGTFQLEGGAFTKLLDKMDIDCFNDIVVGTAVCRPGASDSEFGDQYLNWKNNGIRTYIHEDCDWAVEDTGGAIIFQEQLMHICVDLAGMTKIESNSVRRAVGKKIKADLAIWQERFIQGAAEKIGITAANRLWKNIEASANYSFNLSHAVAYSYNTYWTLWLKHYYPAEYIYALLKHEEENDKKVMYLMEAKRLGVPVKLPHINDSGVTYEIHDNEDGPYIKLGLKQVKHVGEGAAKKIIAKRPFESMKQFSEVGAAKYSGINKRVISSLDQIGAVEFPDNPKRGDEKDFYYEYLNIPAFNWTMLPDQLFDKTLKVDDDAEGIHCIVAMVKKITRKGWCRIDYIDDTGSDGSFVDPNNEIEKGKAYLFIIDGSNIMDYIPVEEVAESDNPIVRYLLLEESKPLNGKERVLMLKSRTTKAGKKMGTLITFTEDLELKSYLVFPAKYHMVYGKAQMGNLVHISAGTTDDGKLTLKGIE